MKELNEDIKTEQFKQIYLLYGEETYLRRQYKEKLRNALMPAHPTVNYSYFEGKDLEASVVAEFLRTVPFFAERRLLVIENSGCLKGASSELVDFIKNMTETAYLIFVEKEIDRRSKLYKVIKENGRVTEFARQSEKTLGRWLVQIAKQEEKTISDSAVSCLLAGCKTDMERLFSEMQKLISYLGERQEITKKDVEEICSFQIESHIFEMLRQVAAGRRGKALAYYEDLLRLRTPPMQILALLTREFRVLLTVKELAGKGDFATIAKQAGIPSFAVRGYLEQQRGFTEEKLREILRECALTDTLIKTGRLKDQMGVELLLMRYTQKN